MKNETMKSSQVRWPKCVVSVVLTSYDCGEMSEDEYDAWVAYATRYLKRGAEKIGLDLTVESDRYGTAGGNRVTCDDDFAEADIREEIISAWNEWCAEGVAS